MDKNKRFNISLIAAMAHSRVIGINNNLPWHLPADMKWFKQNTLQKPIIMGHNTFESIGFALPQRQNIVISRHQRAPIDDIVFVRSIEEAINIAQPKDEIMIIGGASLYEQTLSFANKLYLTHIDTEINGDTFFPDYHKEEWKKIYQKQCYKDEKNHYNYLFEILTR